MHIVSKTACEGLLDEAIDEALTFLNSTHGLYHANSKTAVWLLAGVVKTSEQGKIFFITT